MFDLKALKRLTIIDSVELILELIKKPRHRSLVGHIIVDLERCALEELNLRHIKLLFHERVVVLIVDCDAKLVLWRGLIVG